MVAYFCHHLSDNQVYVSDIHVVLTDSTSFLTKIVYTCINKVNFTQAVTLYHEIVGNRYVVLSRQSLEEECGQ